MKSYLAAATIFSFCGGFALAQQPTEPPCPNSQLAPFGLSPDDHCRGTGCLVAFKNYKWWTAFTYNPSGGYYYNGGLGTTFAPEHVSLGSDGLHLRLAKDWNGGKEWAGAEAVLMFNADGTQANLGYGDYLVVLTMASPAGANWNTYDPNVATGVFNYERYKADPCRGGSKNCAREVDLAEISRWGWNHQSPANCPFSGSIGAFDKATLCKGSAQFALQDYTQAKGMVARYDIAPSEPARSVTLVMKWRKGEVDFQQYNGHYTFGDLPASSDNNWTTPGDLSPFIPDTGNANGQACQRFHINLWLGNFYDPNWNPLPQYAPHAGPTNGQPVEIVVREFQYRPAP